MLIFFLDIFFKEVIVIIEGWFDKFIEWNLREIVNGVDRFKLV